MSNIKVGKLTHRLFTLIVLLACLTIAAAPARASTYQLSGIVYYGWSEHRVKSPEVGILKWDGSSWAYHGVAYADECGNFTYDTGGPGQFMGIVEGYYIVRDGSFDCGVEYAIYYISGGRTAGVDANSPGYMNIIT